MISFPLLVVFLIAFLWWQTNFSWTCCSWSCHFSYFQLLGTCTRTEVTSRDPLIHQYRHRLNSFRLRLQFAPLWATQRFQMPAPHQSFFVTWPKDSLTWFPCFALWAPRRYFNQRWRLAGFESCQELCKLLSYQETQCCCQEVRFILCLLPPLTLNWSSAKTHYGFPRRDRSYHLVKEEKSSF